MESRAGLGSRRRIFFLLLNLGNLLKELDISDLESLGNAGGSGSTSKPLNPAAISLESGRTKLAG